MLSLSQTTGYAIKALACLNEPGCRRRSTLEIAECSGVPRPYLAKIITALVRAGILVSKRGIGGGIALAREPGAISLLQVVEAVEGPAWLGECLLGLDECSSQQTCPTHQFWERLRNEIRNELEQTTLDTVLTFKKEGGAKRATPGCGKAARKETSPRS